MSETNKTLIDQHVEDLAGKRALAEPFPGPLADAFSLAPDIKVGPYSIRRFRDGDFKILNALNSPLAEFLRACLNGDESAGNVKVEPTGQDMWNLAYVFTSPPKACADMIRAGKVDQIKIEAEEVFGELRLEALAMILTAIMDQARIYASANIAYAEKVSKQEGENSSNPPSTAAR